MALKQRIKNLFKKIQPQSQVTAVDWIAELVSTHRKLAQNSPYDYKVSIMAIGAASNVIDSIDAETLSESDYTETVIQKLTELRERYYDSGGEYTSGKGEIGSLISDIVARSNN